ncbi:alpha/beta-hydrolase [Myriangium duriaei CBS 260.36]|uniref:Alpha/beta-hydrolase n=1 Tax=Myriangium duriaei CBS 260.36 TaxID=1168546 RepID=A0A9P4J8W3_9PEZI|nr:alpha/beta-hydrolase [Myriangium duriaei CBS 260.36]
MPYMPPFARSERIADYRAESGPVEWHEHRIASLDGTRLALCVGQMADSAKDETREKLVVLYFQGNGASSPMRIPMLSRSLQDITSATNLKVTVAALSYRGYWTSRGRPSQKGIASDAQAFLTWVTTNYPNAPLLVWGQSLGAGVALNAIGRAFQNGQLQDRVCGIVLETPFVSVRRMLVALYPQKWLPYRHLWPFLRSSWNSELALRDIAACTTPTPPFLLLPAADDEVVPPEEVNHLEATCEALGVEYRREDVLQAFHNDASSKTQGRRCIAQFASSCLQR